MKLRYKYCYKYRIYILDLVHYNSIIAPTQCSICDTLIALVLI